MKFAKCLENRRFPCYNNTNAKSVPSGAQANRTGSGRAYMNCAEIRRLPWLIRLLTSALLAALVLTPAPLALSASRTRPLSMLLLVPHWCNPAGIITRFQIPCAAFAAQGIFLMQKFIDDLIQALYPAAELFLLLWYRAFALFYTLYGTLTHFTERLQGTAKNVQFFTQTIRQHGRYRLNSAVQ